MPSPPAFAIKIAESVGNGGVNNAKDIVKVHRRLSTLGFPVPELDEGASETEIVEMGTNRDFIHAIRLFQGVKNGHEKINQPGNDGRVDPDGDTLQWLNAKNAPLWNKMPAGSKDSGYYNYEVVEDKNDHFKWGTSWLSNTLIAAGDHYLKNFLKTKKGPPITANDVSVERGGPALRARDPLTLDHKGHQCGMSVDLRLPRTDGTAPGGTKTNIASTKYSSSIMEAVLNALHEQPLFKNALLNDDKLIKKGLCTKAAGHYDHAHINIKPPARIDLTPLAESFGQIANHTDEPIVVYGPKRGDDPLPGPFSLWRLPPLQESPNGLSYEGIFVPNDRFASQWKFIDFIFDDTPGVVAVRFGAGLRVEVTIRDGNKYVFPPDRGLISSGDPIGWNVPDWAHDGGEIAALPEVPNTIRARNAFLNGRCTNLSGETIAVYGPKTVPGPTPNVLYHLSNNKMTPLFWDCDGVFVPTDRDATSSRTSSISGRRAVKYVDFQHFQVRAQGTTYQLPFEANIFDQSNTVDWDVPDRDAASLEAFPEVPDQEPPIPDGHGRCINRTDEVLLVYGPHHEEDADNNFVSLYRLPPGNETPDNWHFAGLYLPSDREARLIGVGIKSGSLAIVFPSGVNTIVEKWNDRYSLPFNNGFFAPSHSCSAKRVPRRFLSWPNFGWPFCIQWPIPEITFAEATDPTRFPEVTMSAEVGAPPRKRSGFDRLDKLFYGETAEPLEFADSDRISVGEVHTLLRGHGFEKFPTQRDSSYGRFGPQTKAALLQFCAKHKIECDPQNPKVDRTLLKALVETPMSTPVFGPLLVSLKLSRSWNTWLKIIQLTTLFEGRGKFGESNKGEEDKQGLSYGLLHWTQRSKRLHKEILSAFNSTNPQLFASIFLGASRSQGLLAHTNLARGGLEEDGTSSDSSFDIVKPPWTKAFENAAKEEAFQIVQIDAAVTAYQKMYKRVKSSMPRIKSERGVCFALDLGNQAGPTGAVKIYKAVASSDASGQSEEELLQAMAEESVRKVKTKFKNNVRDRRDWFRNTTLMSTRAFDDLVRAAAEDRR